MQAYLAEREKGLVLWALAAIVSWAAVSQLVGWFWGLVVTLAGGGLFLTPAGEAFVLWQLRARVPARAELERLEAAAEALRTAGVSLPSVQWRVIDDPLPNAYALTRHIVVTRGALEVFDQDELASIIAHEVAHVVEGDTARAQFAYGCSLLLVLVSMLMVGLAAMAEVGRAVGSGDRAGVAGGLVIFTFVFLGLAWVFRGVRWLAEALLAGGSRATEYAADAWAAQRGLGPGLASALSKLPEYVQPGQGRTWLAAVMATHPPLQLRLYRLEQANLRLR